MLGGVFVGCRRLSQVVVMYQKAAGWNLSRFCSVEGGLLCCLSSLLTLCSRLCSIIRVFMGVSGVQTWSVIFQICCSVVLCLVFWRLTSPYCLVSFAAVNFRALWVLCGMCSRHYTPHMEDVIIVCSKFPFHYACWTLLSYADFSVCFGFLMRVFLWWLLRANFLSDLWLIACNVFDEFFYSPMENPFKLCLGKCALREKPDGGRLLLVLQFDSGGVDSSMYFTFTVLNQCFPGPSRVGMPSKWILVPFDGDQASRFVKKCFEWKLPLLPEAYLPGRSRYSTESKDYFSWLIKNYLMN